MKSLTQIRSTFLEYFKKNDHVVLQSGPLIPHNDPTLMFTNSGMVPFKNVFTGLETPQSLRVVTVQKCIRAGGKHNDLENVGYTSRHHTFFEMLGNFSFGDYFKEHAIELAWKLLTQDFSLSPKRLLVTVHDTDYEAASLWKKIAGLPEEKIIPISTGDNFWSMGDFGPCGPCSEIFYDHGENIRGGIPGSPEQDGDRFVEIWNLVFMQFEQKTKEERIVLPRPSIDTGMGLERIAAVLQGYHDNYEIDLFKSLIHSCEELTGVKAQGSHKISHKVIADHVRSAGFMVAEGILPSNEGRGYILRRIVRRAMRHMHLLGCHKPLLHKLIPSLVENMGSAWPELAQHQRTICDILYQEESQFFETLSRGLNMLSGFIERLGESKILSGDMLFKLYDTYGFPPDLTEDVVRQHNITCDFEGFHSAMEKQKQRARASWSGSGEKKDEPIWFTLQEKYGPTDFVGYEKETVTSTIRSLIRDGEEITEASCGEEVEILVDLTPFYAESGGQVCDTGTILAKGLLVSIKDVRKKAGGLFLHCGTVINGTLRSGMQVDLKIDSKRRKSLCANHSATHLIHAALRCVLGNQVAQRGSLVDHDRLRFDFSYSGSVGTDALEKVESMINEIVLKNLSIRTDSMNLQEARKKGALALFGEKYGDCVRVISILDKKEEDKKPFSVELCGGTHVFETGEIGLIRIISETPVGRGVRRIEALTREHARTHLEKQENILKKAASLLKVAPVDIISRIECLLDEKKQLESHLSVLRKKTGSEGKILSKKEMKIGTVSFLAIVFKEASSADLRQYADDAKKQIGSGIVAFFSQMEKKVSVVIRVTEDLVSHFKAGRLIQAASFALGGKGGGGRDDMAQGGGPEISSIEESIEAVQALIQEGQDN